MLRVQDSHPADHASSGNTGTDLESGEPIVFDASAMYAHNECESLNPWNSGGDVRVAAKCLRRVAYHASEPTILWS